MKKLFTLFLGCSFMLLAGCATTTQPNATPPNVKSATTTNSYMFRSPPPAAVQAIHGR